MMGCASKDVFPLPLPSWRYKTARACQPPTLSSKPSRPVLRKVHKFNHVVDWCSEGVQALNELSGHPFSHPPDVPLNALQRSASDHIWDMYRNVPGPPKDLLPAGAFAELCGSSSRYDPTCESGTSPYIKDLASWPPMGAIASPVVDWLDGATHSQIYNWKSEVLCNTEERSCYSNSPRRPRPFLEPTLVQDPSIYADFLKHLDQAGMLTWRVGGETLA